MGCGTYVDCAFAVRANGTVLERSAHAGVFQWYADCARFDAMRAADLSSGIRVRAAPLSCVSFDHAQRGHCADIAARALYFLLVGWWADGLWLTLAWLMVAIWPVTLGVSLAPAFLMFDRLPAVMTLRRT